MPHIERTDQGEQYVFPGTERRTVPGLPYAAEADGQLTLHFYAPPEKSERRPRPTSARALASTPLPAAPLNSAALNAASLNAAPLNTAPLNAVPLPANPVMDAAQAVPAMSAPAVTDSTPQGLFGRRLAHFPRVFEQP
ncbi:hypothetical protein [Azospirillum sp. B510]|uniref:hypothetical protein n=1 Tax=Azospirillum sp. (strain B510) TaxID=137722 RepID=UPI0003036931|nr:hypothetical protein [Azospirillum sp. B510]